MTAQEIFVYEYCMKDTHQKKHPRKQTKVWLCYDEVQEYKRAIRLIENPDANGGFTQRFDYNHRGEGLRRKLRGEILTMYKCTVQ